MLDTKPLDLVQKKKEKAELLYLRGKCLDFIPEYTKQAEENLSKSIKLMPTKCESWEALGHVYWKKRDIEQSKKCFEGCLEQDENNKQALRNLSMVYRQLETSSNGDKLDAEERKKNYQLSIQLATKAISLDLTASESWYVLGNAHLTNFFQNNESTLELEHALKAYAQTEKNLKEANPDLFFNRGTIFEYLERYNEAVCDFETAHKIDPNLGADKKCEGIIAFVARCYNSINQKGKLKTNRLIDMVKSIPQILPGEDSSKTKVVDISHLQSGENPGLIISAKVVNFLDKSSDVPMCFLLVDFKHNFCVTSIYHMSGSLTEKIRTGSEVLIKNPHLVLVQCSYKGYNYSYQCLKVTDIKDILVNGSSLLEETAQSEVVSKTFQ